MSEADFINWVTDKPLLTAVLLYILWRVEHKWIPIFEDLRVIMTQVKEHLRLEDQTPRQTQPDG